MFEVPLFFQWFLPTPSNRTIIIIIVVDVVVIIVIVIDIIVITMRAREPALLCGRGRGKPARADGRTPPARAGQPHPRGRT